MLAWSPLPATPIVVDGETGWLIPVEVDQCAGQLATMRHPSGNSPSVHAAVSDIGDSQRRARGRSRVEREVIWRRTAEHSLETYREAVAEPG